jgi:hypothetical protein
LTEAFGGLRSSKRRIEKSQAAQIGTFHGLGILGKQCVLPASNPLPPKWRDAEWLETQTGAGLYSAAYGLPKDPEIGSAIGLAIMELGDKASTMTEAEWKGFCGICVPEWQVRRCGIIKDEVFLQIERRLVEQRKRAREMLLGAGRADLVIQFNKKFGRSIIISAARGRRRRASIAGFG